MGALHLLLLEIEILDKPLDIPFISSQFVKKLPAPFIWKEAIKIIILSGKKEVEIGLSLLFFLG
jgi:hypothetical protein